jgi:hypothetical protein
VRGVRGEGCAVLQGAPGGDTQAAHPGVGASAGPGGGGAAGRRRGGGPAGAGAAGQGHEQQDVVGRVPGARASRARSALARNHGEPTALFVRAREGRGRSPAYDSADPLRHGFRLRAAWGSRTSHAQSARSLPARRPWRGGSSARGARISRVSSEGRARNRRRAAQRCPACGATQLGQRCPARRAALSRLLLGRMRAAPDARMRASAGRCSCPRARAPRTSSQKALRALAGLGTARGNV